MLHSIRFGAWIVLNLGLLGAMIVILEAIFLSTFVMVSQNRQAARADVRSQLDFETNLRAEIWAVHIGNALSTACGPRGAGRPRGDRRFQASARELDAARAGR